MSAADLDREEIERRAWALGQRSRAELEAVASDAVSLRSAAFEANRSRVRASASGRSAAAQAKAEEDVRSLASAEAEVEEIEASRGRGIDVRWAVGAVVLLLAVPCSIGIADHHAGAVVVAACAFVAGSWVAGAVAALLLSGPRMLERAFGVACLAGWAVAASIDPAAVDADPTLHTLQGAGVPALALAAGALFSGRAGLRIRSGSDRERRRAARARLDGLRAAQGPNREAVCATEAIVQGLADAAPGEDRYFEALGTQSRALARGEQP